MKWKYYKVVCKIGATCEIYHSNVVNEDEEVEGFKNESE